VGTGASGDARTGNAGQVNGEPDRSTAPNMAQWQLGVRLRSLLNQRELPSDEAAKLLLWPLSRLQELEYGLRRPTGKDLAELVALLKVDEATAEELAALAGQAQEQGWWTRFRDLQLPYIGLEGHASSITSYTTHYFPALLQTAGYARAIISGIMPKIEADILKERVEARLLRRQHVLDRIDRPDYLVLLDESVLQRPVGGYAVMREQLSKTASLIEDRKASVRILPLSVGANAAQDSNFVLLDFAEPDVTSTVYVEGLAGSRLLDNGDHLERYREAIGYLLEAALSPDDSLLLIAETQKSYENK
jgi:uncharacterized protein DUF5753